MQDLNIPIFSPIDLQRHYVYRNGYIFTSIREPSNVFDTILIRYPENCDCCYPKLGFSEKSIDEHIGIINKHKLKKAIIIADNIDFITKCPTLEHILIIPSKTAKNNFDYSPLYKMQDVIFLSCTTEYGENEMYSTTIDYSNFNKLKILYIKGKGHLNYNKVKSIEFLSISENNQIINLEFLENQKELKEIQLHQVGLKNLNGFSKLHKLDSVSINYCRKLSDIGELQYASTMLKKLSIYNCPKISDFSILHNLVNLEHLELIGNNKLPHLKFLYDMKKIKTLVFSMHINDCDLTPCMGVPYACSVRNKKEYNLRDKDLPKRMISQGI